MEAKLVSGAPVRAARLARRARGRSRAAKRRECSRRGIARARQTDSNGRRIGKRLASESLTCSAHRKVSGHSVESHLLASPDSKQVAR